MSFRVIYLKGGRDYAIQIKTLHLFHPLHFEFCRLWPFRLTVVDDISVFPVVCFDQKQMIFLPLYWSAIVVSSLINNLKAFGYDFEYIFVQIVFEPNFVLIFCNFDIVVILRLKKLRYSL